MLTQGWWKNKDTDEIAYGPSNNYEGWTAMAIPSSGAPSSDPSIVRNYLVEAEKAGVGYETPYGTVGSDVFKKNTEGFSPGGWTAQGPTKSNNIATRSLLGGDLQGYQQGGNQTAPGGGVSTQPANPPVSSGPQALSTNDLMAKSDPEYTVEGILNRITNSDSHYIRSARSGAARTANARGLLNTSIAAGSGEKAAIESALPIAQQDANSYQTNLNTAQQGMITSKLSSQEAMQAALAKAKEYEYQANLYRLQGDINSALQAQGAAETLRQSAADYQEASQLSTQEFNQTAAMSAQQWTQETALQNNRQNWQTLENEAVRAHDITSWNLDRQNNFGVAANNLFAQYSVDRTNILMSPDFDTEPDRQAALDYLDAAFRSDLNMLASTYEVMLDWGEEEPGDPGDQGGGTTETGIGVDTENQDSNIDNSELSASEIAAMGGQDVISKYKDEGYSNAQIRVLKSLWIELNPDQSFESWMGKMQTVSESETLTDKEIEVMGGRDVINQLKEKYPGQPEAIFRTFLFRWKRSLTTKPLITWMEDTGYFNQNPWGGQYMEE
jgi:hypothetical protein